MKLKILLMLCALFLVACKEDAKKQSEIEEQVPVVSEGDTSEDDAGDSGEQDPADPIDPADPTDPVDPEDPIDSGDPTDPVDEPLPGADTPPDEDTTVYSDKFWENFSCGASCETENFSSDLVDSSYAQVELPITPAQLDSVDVVEISSEAVTSNVDTRYLANDIQVESLGDGMVKVTNNTARHFSSILTMHTTDTGSAPLKIEFDTILSGFSSVTFSGVPDGALDYVETAPILNLDIAYKGQSVNCDEYINSGTDWACVRNPTQAEANTLKALSANIKWFMNTYHFSEALDAFAFGHEYMGHTPSKTCTGFEGCGVKYSVTENMMFYLFSLASTGHRLDVGKLVVSGRGWVGVGSGRTPFQFFGEGRTGWMGLTKTDALFKGNYVTFMHELGHGAGYNHTTGFTYGFPHFAGQYVFDLLGNTQVVESVPPEVFLSKGWRDGNLYLKVYSSNDSAEKLLKLQGLSLTAFGSTAYVSEDGSTIKVEFSEPPKQRLLVRVFSGESDLVMTKDVAPGMLMLDDRSNEDLLVINDGVLSEIIEKEVLLRSRIDKSPKVLDTLCNKLFRKGDNLVSPTADTLTMLSGDATYYESFKGEPFYVRGGVDSSAPGTFNFESLVFTQVPNNEPLTKINLGCMSAI